MKKQVFLLLILFSLFFIIISYSNIKASENIRENNSAQNNNDNNKISLNLNWDDDIRNGVDFDVNIEVNNLLDKTYDVKVFIYNDDKNKPISQVNYNDKWLSSTSYMNELISGPGDTTKTITMRINNKYIDFYGSAFIGVRIREHGSKTYQEQFLTPIEIIESEDANSIDNTDSTSSKRTGSDNYVSSIKNSKSTNNIAKSINQNNNENITESQITEDVIHLGGTNLESESIKTKKNIVYESKNESIKKYSIYSFIVLLVIFFSMFIFLKSRNKKVYIDQ